MKFKIIFSNVKNYFKRVMNAINNWTVMGLLFDVFGTWILTIDYRSIISSSKGTGMGNGNGALYPFALTFPEPYLSYYNFISRIGFSLILIGSVMCLSNEIKDRFSGKGIRVGSNQVSTFLIYVFFMSLFLCKKFLYPRIFYIFSIN